MKNQQRGFIVPLLLAIIAILLVGGGIYVYTQNKQPAQAVTESPSVQPTTLVQEQTQTTTTTTSSDTFPENEILASLKTNWTATQTLISFRPSHPGTTAWLSPDSVQFIGENNLLVRFEDGYNPGIAVLNFQGNTFKVLETFKNQAEFTLSAWQNLVTKYGASLYPVSTYTTSLVRNGQIVSYVELTKVSENVFVKK